MRDGTSVILTGDSIHNDIRWINSLGTEIESLVSGMVDIALADKVCRQAGQVREIESMLEEEGIVASNLVFEQADIPDERGAQAEDCCWI
jgi:hypothetical protein